MANNLFLTIFYKAATPVLGFVVIIVKTNNHPTPKVLYRIKKLCLILLQEDDIKNGGWGM